MYYFRVKADVPGKAYTGDMCEYGHNCGVSSDYRIYEFTTTAHELGHRYV